jgi:hypothetical protein
MREFKNDCARYASWMLDITEGTLSGDKKSELEQHLTGCARCRAELLLQKRITGALVEEVRPRLSIDFTQRVSRRALEIAELEGRAPLWPRLATALTLAVSACALVFIGAELSRKSSGVLWPFADTFSTAIARVGDVLSGILLDVVRLPGRYLTGLEGLSDPLSLGLILVVSVLPLMWCFQKVTGVLRH